MYSDQPTRPVAYRYHRPDDQKGRRGCGCLSRLLFGGIILLALIIFTGTIIAGTLVYVNLSAEIEEGITALDDARNRETFETTRINDREGRLLWEVFGEGKRTQVNLDQVPQDLINATIATEDDTFYENTGLDAPSLIAALIANLRNPDERPQGGSSITQQLVRHIVFDYQERSAVSYDRKTKEIILAWIMNRKFAKDEILEMYLNEIYYGNLAYGAEAAAQTYFGKPVSELNLAESSLLAGLPQSPVELDPLQNLEKAKQRQWLVLNLMVSEGFIGQADAETAYLAPLTFAPQEVSLEAPHFAVYVRQLLEEQFGPEVVANGGLQVTTTLDLDYQRLAELLATQHVDEVGPGHNLTNASLVALKPGTGEILAMLGSLEYRDETIDGNVNIALSGQQPGSAIKPLTYAAAMSPQPESTVPAWTAADLLWDVPVDYEQFDGTVYSPVNYDRSFHGPVRLRDALANSYNIPAILALQDIGIPHLMELADRMGIESWQQDPGRYGLSLTLGGGEVTPLELTSAYAVFANGGFRVPPTAILHVEKGNGEVLYDYQQPVAEQALDPRVAFLVSDVLDDDSARIPAMGTNNPLDLPFPAAAKTGTSNDFRDNWTVGYTPGLALGVWTGNTDNSEMIDVSGLTGAAPLWSAYMQAVYSDYELQAVLQNESGRPPTEFVPPNGLERRNICNLNSITIGAIDCQLDDSEWFLITDETSQLDAGSDEESVEWTELDPGVWRIPAVALPPIPEELQVSLQLLSDSDTLPPQAYCHFEQGIQLDLLPPDALPSLFLSPPRNLESLISAHEWAANHNLPILPAATCTGELLAAARDPNNPAVWRISSPGMGDTVDGVIPIVGTADFDPTKVQFYKLELGMGDLQNPEWVTLGEARNQPVVNGNLEMLHADALPPGEYLLRLILVKWDGNYVGEPHTVKLVFE
jgi:membrane peptidoglycan carboxypeptidase